MLLSLKLQRAFERKKEATGQSRGNTGGKEGINVPCESKIACKKTA